MTNVVEALSARFIPLLKQAALRLREKHPTFIINVGSGSIGGATTFQGYSFYLEALRPDSTNPEPNCVAMEICVRNLPDIPFLCGLDVSWGADGSAPSEGLCLLDSDCRFGPEALRLIDNALPRLERHFDFCLHAWEVAYPTNS